MALAAGEGLAQAAVRTGDTAAVPPPGGQSKAQGCVPAGDKATTAASRPHTPVTHRLHLWLQKAAGQCPSCPSQLPAAPSLQGLCVGSCSSLLPQGSSLALSLHGQSPCSATEKKKSSLSKPRPAPPCPHEPVHGDGTPVSDNLAVPLCGLSWFSLHDISRSLLSTLNPPAGPRPIFTPPQHKALAAAQSCQVLGSGSPVAPGTAQWHLALPK